jgi:hypothetical protein
MVGLACMNTSESGSSAATAALRHDVSLASAVLQAQPYPNGACDGAVGRAATSSNGSTNGDSARAEDLLRRGGELELSGDARGAQAVLHSAACLNGGNASVARQLARVSESLGDTMEAVASYRRYLLLAPNAQDARAVRARLASLDGSAVVATTQPTTTVASTEPAPLAASRSRGRVSASRRRAMTEERAAPAIHTSALLRVPREDSSSVTLRESGGEMADAAPPPVAAPTPDTTEESPAPAMPEQTRTSTSHTVRDAAVGAAAGAIIGAVIGRDIRGAAVGAAAGGVLGAVVGRNRTPGIQ